MQEINLPEGVDVLLKRVALLSVEQFDLSMNIIEHRGKDSQPDNLSSDKAADRAISEVVPVIIEATANLATGRAIFDLNNEEFIGRLNLSGATHDSPAAIHDLRERLSRMLSLKESDVAAKAVTLQSEAQRTMIDTRITSDIRPVFGDRGDEDPIAAMVVHSLRIDFRENRNRNSFYVLVDSEDIAAIHAACERAMAKEKSLRKFLKNKIGLLAGDAEDED